MKIIERNLQELGKSLFVSLPKSWTQSFKLKKGSKIKMIIAEKGHLTIAPEFTKEKEKERESEIVYDQHFKKRLFREYFQGYEKITIIFPIKISKQEKRNIYSTIKRFMSIQIIEENEKQMTLKSFKIEELSMDECLKRIYFLTLNILEEKSETNDQTSITEMRDTITKFYYLLVMQIRRYLDEGKFTKENQIPLIRAMDYRMVAEKFQRISELSENLAVKKTDLENITDYFQKTGNAFIHQNFQKAPELWETGEKLNKKIKNKKSDLSQILRFTREISALLR
jgi:phosphate uptake regulator